VLPETSRGSWGKCRARRRRVDGEAATFVGGEGALVGGDDGCGVLQHWRGKGREKIARKCRDWQLGEELTGEWRTAAVLGRNPQGRVYCQWLEAAVRVRGAVGRLGRLRGGVGEEWRREDEWSSASEERAARRQRDRGGKRREKVGIRAWGCHAARECRGAWPRPVETERGETSDGWAAAQCRAAVPLTGGAGLSAGAGKARARVDGCADVRGPAREETGTSSPDAQ
jgi:hypothetical protein